jgi:hypothetical protein
MATPYPGPNKAGAKIVEALPGLLPAGGHVRSIHVLLSLQIELRSLGEASGPR